ncbi:MAG: PaaI family thioesterase [Parvibaculum sp.]|nr:PaaI family thioesterase [Parvibaculum sp.]
MTASPFPAGFTQVQTEGFGGFAGPVMGGTDDKGPLFLMDIAYQHLNGADRLHGGMMMSLMSIVMGEVAAATAKVKDASAVTRPLSLNCDFVSAGETDERIEGRAEVTRATRSVMFISGTLAVGPRVLMTATGVYAIKAAE